MTAKLMLRIAAIAMLLHTTGHTLAAITWDQAPNKQVGSVVKAMKDNHFEFFGTGVSLASSTKGLATQWFLCCCLSLSCFCYYFCSAANHH